MWVMSFEILVHITFRNDTFYLHRGRVILNSSSILQHSGTYSVFCYPSRLGGIPWLQQFNNFKGFSTVSYVRHIIELLSYSGSFPVLLCTWNVCLVSTLDPSFKVAGRWLRGGRTDWFGYSVVGMMCRHLMNCNIELCPDHCLVSVRFLHSAIVDCYFILCIFPVSASSISLCRCYCTCILSCGCVGLSVRR